MKKQTKFNFEKNVTNVILSIIKENQEYLTKPENLPQLSKLGYMFEVLFLYGRVCYGFNGKIQVSKQCENNPKYEIEKCDPKNYEIENLIYDAWSMHVGHLDKPEDVTTWKQFSNVVLKGEKLSDKEKLEIKPNKTMDDWVELLMKPNGYLDSKRSVYNTVMFVNGTGLVYANGYVIKGAGGARLDVAIYGDWKNAKFSPEIDKKIKKLMALPEVKKSFSVASKSLLAEIAIIEGIRYRGQTKEQWHKDLEEYRAKEALKPQKYRAYYDVSSYSNISKFDNHTHPSYIDAGLECCQEIMEHKEEEAARTVEFAKSFINRFKKRIAKKRIPKVLTSKTVIV